MHNYHNEAITCLQAPQRKSQRNKESRRSARKKNCERRHTCLQQARYATDGLHDSGLCPRSASVRRAHESFLPKDGMLTMQSRARGQAGLGFVVVINRDSVHALGQFWRHGQRTWWGVSGSGYCRRLALTGLAD
jgi:hypothetical protein